MHSSVVMAEAVVAVAVAVAVVVVVVDGRNRNGNTLAHQASRRVGMQTTNQAIVWTCLQASDRPSKQASKQASV